MTVFEEYYSHYMNTQEGFDEFHNEVINMPRDEFSSTNLQKIRMLAGYIVLTEGKLDSTGFNYKEVMECIKNELNDGNFPEYRDEELESRYFSFSDINAQYNDEGRMFRHIMSTGAFFGFVESISKQKKTFNYDKCREYLLSDDRVLMPVARNNIMLLNAKTNDFIKSLKGITIDSETDYRPTYGILRYMSQINRPVTKFELSILLGRIDSLKKEVDIINRAVKIGSKLPAFQREQIPYVFSNMGWKHNGQFYEYANSQQPYFKFNNYLLFLEAFELIEFNNITETYTLTTYATDILEDDISYLVADLERLIAIVDDYSADSGELNDIIICQRNPELLQLAREDTTFIQRMNIRSMNNPRFDRKGKKIRNRLIAELAKIQADYKCQYSQRHIFKMPNGKYYCEAHHIIEFSTEEGADITNNLVVLGPEAHMLIHHACKEEVDDAFYQLRVNGALDIERFKEMITIYHCLTPEQIAILCNRNVITSRERDELLELLAS